MRSVNPFLVPKNITYDHLTKIKGLVTTIVILNLRAHDFVTEFVAIDQVYRVIHSGFVSQELL